MLAGRRAVLTGSTSGIGLAMARRLAKNGAAIVLNGFGAPDEIEATRSSIEKESGVRVEFIHADLSKRDEVHQLIATSIDRLGGVDILVNNAGIQHVAPVHAYPDDTYDKLMAINLHAVFHASKAVLPGMIERRWGRIISTASVHGLVASRDKAPYCASKHGVVGFTKSLALETAGSGITCNAICPGFVKTPLLDAQIVASAQKAGVTVEEGERVLLGPKQPSMQFVTGDQLGDFCVFLCSDAAAQMTGTALPMDGGWTAQ